MGSSLRFCIAELRRDDQDRSASKVNGRSQAHGFCQPDVLRQEADCDRGEPTAPEPADHIHKTCTHAAKIGWNHILERRKNVRVINAIEQPPDCQGNSDQNHRIRAAAK